MSCVIQLRGVKLTLSIEDDDVLYRLKTLTFQSYNGQAMTNPSGYPSMPADHFPCLSQTDSLQSEGNGRCSFGRNGGLPPAVLGVGRLHRRSPGYRRRQQHNASHLLISHSCSASLTSSPTSSGGSADEGAKTDGIIDDCNAAQYPWTSLDMDEMRRVIQNMKTNKRRLRYIKKVKNERETLKRQKAELSAELSSLQQARARAKAKVAENFSTLTWKATVVRQKERRLKSEEQQRQLKNSVMWQQTLIHQMNELLQQRVLNCPAEGLEEKSTQGASLFKTFMRELDGVYAMTNEVVSSAQCKFEVSPRKYGWTRLWNEDKKILESADATIVPFGFKQTCDAMAKVLLANSGWHHCPEEIIDRDDSTAARYRLDMSEEFDDSGVLLIHIVVKRYVEAGRVVFVWRALVEGQGDFEGLYTDDTAWHIVRPLNNEKEGTGMVLESHTKLVSVGFDAHSGADVRGNEFVKVLIRADELDTGDLIQRLENTLTIS